jgi:hypothetical protein
MATALGKELLLSFLWQSKKDTSHSLCKKRGSLQSKRIVWHRENAVAWNVPVLPFREDDSASSLILKTPTA